MSVRVRVLPETEPQEQRSHARRWLTTTVATAVIAVIAGIAIAAADNPDAGRGPSDGPRSARLTGTAPPDQWCDNWRFNDPRVQKGARGAPIG